ncbi:FtsB family cell division protein [Brevundimonas sp.]|uniref:FtsB family cell division protein n=1 Tax=Brevundimonas sp. TaxID=1871086 RepID=UPI002ABAC725|nr:septum formation initiator family protein [Brevundimonas sp.]MDZ4364132.1 septum formation initiator family protein [Brevundimonas sp.]
MLDRMKPYALCVFLFLLVGHFGVQALTGPRGLLSGADRAALLALREHELDTLLAERADLEVRIRYLRNDSLSLDLLEERARAVLGFADPRDYVIPVSRPATPEPVAPKAS